MEMDFQVELRKELNQTRLRLRLAGLYIEDYQIRMLRENRLKGVLPMRGYGEGESTVYEYDITGRTSLRQYYKQRKITWEEMNLFLKQIQEVISETEGYLLNPNRLLLNPDYIFYKLLYQGISRPREKLCIVVIDNMPLFEKILSIKLDQIC